MDDATADVVKDAIQKEFPGYKVSVAWYCPRCEVFGKKRSEVVDDDGACANCREVQAVRIIVVE